MSTFKTAAGLAALLLASAFAVATAQAPPQDLELGPIFSTRARREHALLSYDRRGDMVKEWLLNAARWSLTS